ncbi:hypothetical protein ACNBSC_005089, partial [Escherichia coli]
MERQLLSALESLQTS